LYRRWLLSAKLLHVLNESLLLRVISNSRATFCM
jgi:hypothetical protein